MTYVVAIALIIILFITVDIVFNVVKGRRRPASPTEVKRETERLMRTSDPRVAQVEAEVERKLKELKRRDSARLSETPGLPEPAAGPAAPAPERDPMNDTRCMQAVKEKVEEVERIGRERGVKK